MSSRGPPISKRGSSAEGTSSQPSPDTPSLKIVVVGDYGVGKTSLIRQLTQRQFLVQSGTTIGVEFREHRFDTAILQLWDIAGQQYCSTMTKQYYRWASAAVVVADISKESTFDVALEWKRDVVEKIGGSSQPQQHSSPNQSNNNNINNGSPPLISRNKGDEGGASAVVVKQTMQQPPKVSSNADDSPIPIFLFVNKGDLLDQSTFTPESLQEFAEKNGFHDVCIVSARDYHAVQDAFKLVTDFVLQKQFSLLTSSKGSSTGETNNNSSPPSTKTVNLQALRRTLKKDQEGTTGKRPCCRKS